MHSSKLGVTEGSMIYMQIKRNLIDVCCTRGGAADKYMRTIISRGLWLDSTVKEESHR